MTGVEEAAAIGALAEGAGTAAAGTGAAAGAGAGATAAGTGAGLTATAGTGAGLTAAEGVGGGLLSEVAAEEAIRNAGMAGLLEYGGTYGALTGEQMTNLVAQAALADGVASTGEGLTAAEALKDTSGNAVDVNQALDQAHQMTLQEYGNPADLTGQQQMEAVKAATPWYDSLQYKAQGMANNLTSKEGLQGMRSANSAMQMIQGNKQQPAQGARPPSGSMDVGGSTGRQTSSFQTFSPYQSQGIHGAGFNPNQMNMAGYMANKQPNQFDQYQQMLLKKSLLG